MLPNIPSPVFRTPSGIPYLKAPGIAVTGVPHSDQSGLADFLGGFDKELGFDDYLNDPDTLPGGEELIKVGGQLCYLSFGKQRSWNRDAGKYLTHIKESGHGSVLEHAFYTVVLYGISRSVTHELVRHRVGIGFSQVSQRYVDGKKLRFVERPEYQQDPKMHADFERWVEAAKAEYDDRAEKLMAQLLPTFPADMPKTERRKRVNQAARSILPNETEAPIQVTANARAWRHLTEMRAAGPAEVEIRRMQFGVYQCLRQVAPLIFDDYEVVTLSDGTQAVKTQYRKV